MSWAARLRSVARSALRRGQMEKDMDAELRFHVAAYTEDLVRSGVAPEEAERRARVEFGHLEPIKEDCRQARGLRLLDEMSQDLRYAGRMLRKSPGFAAVTVLTLAFGIGANAAIFSVVNAWVLKPLPFPNPDHLVAIFSTDRKHNLLSLVSPADLYDWRHTGGAFEEICGWTNPFFTLQLGDRPKQLIGARVNWPFFHLLGISPAMGRDFLPQDDRPGAAPVALLSDELWKSDFNGDPGLAGKTIRVDGENVTVIGVLPPGFHLPLAGPARLWMPLAFNEEALGNRRGMYVSVIGRMKPGYDLKSATNYLQTLALRLERQYPESNAGRGARVITLADAIGQQGGNDRALVLFALVGCVLLIACANVANLIVGRAVSRQREMAVRLAMGAGRARVLRQLLIENLLLFLVAAALSVLVAIWGVHWIAQSIPVNFRAYLPDEARLRVDPLTLLYTLAIGVTTGLLFGFEPAFRSGRTDVMYALRDGTSRVTSVAGSSRLRNGLITLEVALALIVLIASGLLVKGLLRMYNSDPGFNPSGVVTAQITLGDPKYAPPERAGAFFEDVLDRIAREPGVEAAAAASFQPYSGAIGSTYYAIDGRPALAPGNIPFFSLVRTTPGYFKTMGQPILLGRGFSESDSRDAAPVIVINHTMAQRNWPGENPVGRRIHYGMKLDRAATIVGVVADTRGMNDMDVPAPAGFLPLRQSPVRSMMLAIRTAPGAADLSRRIQQAVARVDQGLPVSEVRTMQDLMAERQAPFRIVGQVTTLFSGLSLFLAALGIYGVVAHSVAARRQEFGIRVALGAGRTDLLRLAVGQGMKLALAGLMIGLSGALALTRLMSSVLYHVSPTDPATFSLISGLLLLTALLACYLPARRASDADPVRSLKYE